MSFSKIKKLTSCLVLGAMLFSQSVSALVGWTQYSYPIGAGTTYIRQEGYNESGVQKASIITYKPNSTVTPIAVKSGDSFYGNRKSISQISSSLESQGYDVIGGINADFFSFSDGIPTGLFVDKGRLIAATDWESAIGFMADGSAIIGDPISNIVVSGASGSISVFDYNKTRTTRGLYLLDKYYSDSTHFGSQGKSIIMEYDDPSTLKIGQPATFTVVDKVSGSTSFPIADNQMVLTRRDDCTSMPWIDYQIGERITITFNTTNPQWGNVVYAVGGKKLITNGVTNTYGIDSGTSLAARSAAGIKADGTVVLYEVDGSQSGYSKGLTAKQLITELQQLGCVSAVCLDGGGSSAMTVKNPINDKSTLVTSPSDGSERKCSTYIFLINTALSDGVASSIHLEPKSHFVLLGGQIPFSTTVLDTSFNKTSTEEEIIYTASAGSVANGVYTAPNEIGTVTITAKTESGIYGTMQLYVTDEPTSMTLSKSGQAVSSVSTKMGVPIQIDAVTYRNGVQIFTMNSQIKWSVSGDIGTISNGLFTPSKIGTGKITASYGGVSKTVSVSVSMGDAQKLQSIANFEQNQPFSSDVKLSVTNEVSNVFRGYNALKIEGANANLTISPVTINGEKVLTLWAKSSGQGDIKAVFIDAAGQEILVPFDKSLKTSYNQLKVTIPSNAVAFAGLKLSNSTSTYIDHIIMSQTVVNNTDAPAITVSASNLNISAGQSASVTAKITQNSASSPVRSENIKVYVDGVLTNSTYTSTTLQITTGALNAGTHVIILEVSDDAGNLSRKVFTINAGTRTNSKFSDISNSWAAGYINLLSDRGIMNGSVGSNGALQFKPNNNLTRAEFAVLMSNVLNLDTSSTELPFDDSDKIPSWAKGAVAAVYNAGIMNGQGAANDKVNFNSNAAITRTEVMAVIARCLPRGYVSKSLSFKDAAQIPSWAKEEVTYVVSAEIISGNSDNTLKPNANITRAEISSVIAKFK